MKSAAFAAIVFVSLFPLRADLTLVQEVQAAGEAPMEMTLFSSGSQWRVEQAKVGMLQMTDGKSYTLMHTEKMYMEFNPAMFRGQPGAAGGGQGGSGGRPENYQWEKTGKKDRIAGYTAEQWIGKKNGQAEMEVWIGGKSSFRDLIKNIAPESWGEKMAGAFRSSSALPGAEGIPLKTVMLNADGSPRMTMLVKKVDEGAVDPKWFQIPPDYNKFDMPDLSGMGAAGAGGMPSIPTNPDGTPAFDPNRMPNVQDLPETE